MMKQDTASRSRGRRNIGSLKTQNQLPKLESPKFATLNHANLNVVSGGYNSALSDKVGLGAQGMTYNQDGGVVKTSVSPNLQDDNFSVP